MKKVEKRVLIVDDNPGHTNLLEEAIKQLKPCPEVNVLHDGNNLFTWLEANLRPDLIFLDVQIPGENGFVLLQALKTKSDYKTIPVIMFTGSEDGSEITKSYEIGANAYMTKPTSFALLVPQMQALNYFWFNEAVIPSLASLQQHPQ